MRKASVVLKFGLAVISVAIALGLSLLGQSQTVEKLEFPLLLMAIAVTVWYAGTVPGVVAVALSSCQKSTDCRCCSRSSPMRSCE